MLSEIPAVEAVGHLHVEPDGAYLLRGQLQVDLVTLAFAKQRPNTHVFVNLDPITYWSLLSQVDAMVGNSSSGIMEAASFGLPVVNVGIRQQGRERAANILDAPAEAAEIRRALAHALDDSFKRSLDNMKNPYGDGSAAQIISRVLATVSIDKLLIKAPSPVHCYAEPTKN